MNINSIAGSISQQNVAGANKKLQAVVESLISGKRLNRASDDIASLTIATQLQSQTAGLRQISSNIAQTQSLVQVADGGIAQIQDALSQLQDIAQKAKSPTLNAAARADLNEQFQELAKQVDQIVQGTAFGDKKLLNGDTTLSLQTAVSGAEAGADDTTLAIPDLSGAELLGTLDISTAEGAQQALEALSLAFDAATAARAAIGAFSGQLDYVAANLDSAGVNLAAALSTLEDTDFTEASTQFSLAEIQSKASTAIAAQANKLPSSLINLIS